MATLLAIDFGTHRCSMAYMGPEGAKVITSQSGAPNIPAVVAFTSQGVVAGQDAVDQAVTNPEGTVFSIKRLLGRKFQSPEVQWLAGSFPYPIVASDNGDAHLHVAGRIYSPEEVASYLLEHLRELAESQLGGPVEAVITVPSFMDELGRRALLTAAKLAGLRVKLLLSATSAAAMMCLGDRRQTLAILDLGAGGFDVALVGADPKGMTVMATAGDPMLGGDDIDRRLAAAWLLGQAERTGEDLSGDPVVLRWVLEQARAVKHELSYKQKTEAMLKPLVTSSGAKAMVQIPEMTRGQLADLVAEDTGRLLEPCHWAFEDAQIKPRKIKAVYVVGGMARMPAVQDAVETMFSQSPRTLGNADHIVALGAARCAAAIFGKGEDATTLREVLGASVGLKVSGGRFEPVIRRNQPTPCTESRVFRTARADQDRIVFEVFQGECEMAADNAYVGRFVVDNLRNQRQFETMFRVDRNGLLHVGFVDARTGIRKDAPLQYAGGLSDKQLAKLRTERATRRRRRPTDQRIAHSPAPKRPPVTLTPRPEGMLRSKPPQTRPFQSDPSASSGPIEMDDDSLIGSELDDRYVIEAILGEGGMGRVYRAKHKMLGKRFAIKVLHPELAASKSLARRFIEEARSASSIKSPHVIDISDFGALADGTGYFVMEYLDGPSLQDVLDADRHLALTKLVAIGSQVARGLYKAHELKIVHRDLKPTNVMIVHPDEAMRCVILDFGIAKHPTSDSRSAVTRAGIRVGTPEYMAPEQIDDRAVDGRTDIYALGIMLYELSAGRRPFDAESNAELLMSQMYEPARPVKEVNPRADCPPELQAILDKCLEKNPDDRYSTALEVAKALEALV